MSDDWWKERWYLLRHSLGGLSSAHLPQVFGQLSFDHPKYVGSLQEPFSAAQFGTLSLQTTGGGNERTQPGSPTEGEII